MKISLPDKAMHWVVVADEGHANVFGRESAKAPLELLFELDNETARMKGSDLASDRGGRSFDSGGQGRHTMEPSSEPHREAALRFAGDLMSAVENAHHAGLCKDFALIAPPRFLGVIRARLDSRHHFAPAVTIVKDLVQHDVADIEASLRDHDA